jgi:flagellar biogenesis protein FliO
VKRLFILLFLTALSGQALIAQTNLANDSATNENMQEEISDYMSQFDWGDEAIATEEAEEQYLDEAPSPFWSAIKIILFTAIFAFIAYFVVRLIVGKSGVPSAEDDEIIETLLTKQVGLGNYLAIIKVGPTYYLFSLSGNGIQNVDKIDDKETIDYLELHKDKYKPKQSKFIDILSYLPKGKKPDKFGFMKKTKDKLKKM